MNVQMSPADTAAQTELEDALNRFYNNSDAQSKRDIEAGLEQFKQRPDAWMLACKFLQSSQNAYLLWFSSSLLDEFVRKSWDVMPTDNKTQLRTFLMSYVQQKSAAGDNSTNAKASKALIEIAKRDWPASYPDFMDTVIQLCTNEQSAVLGLTLLKLVSEEFVCLKDTALGSTRKHELKVLLLEQLPRILNVLGGILQASLQGTKDNQSAPSLLSKLSLEILSDAMRWAPINKFTDQLVNLVFEYLALVEHEHGILSVVCINEMLEKRYVPHDFAAYFAQLTKNLLKIFELLASQSDLSAVDDAYLTCFILLISNYSKSHLARIADLPGYLTILYKFTFSVTDSDMFSDCLDIWSGLVEDVNERDNVDMQVVDGFSSLALELLNRIQWTKNSEFLLGFSMEANTRTETTQPAAANKGTTEDILNFQQLFEHTMSELTTDLSYLVNQCACLILDISHLALSRGRKIDEILQTAFTELNSRMEFILQSNLDTSNKDHVLVASRDCATMFLILSYLAKQFASPHNFQAMFVGAAAIVEGAVKVVQLCANNRLHTRGSHFVQLQVNALKAIGAFGLWLVHYGVASRVVPEQAGAPGVGALLLAQQVTHPTSFQALLEQVFNAVYGSLATTIAPPPASVMAAAVASLNALLHVVPLDLAMQHPSVRGMFEPQSLGQLASSFPLQVQKMLYLAVSTCFTSKVASLPRNSPDTPQYVNQHKLLLEPLVSPLAACANVNQPIPHSDASRLRKSFSLLATIVQATNHQTTAVKALVFEAIQSGLQGALKVLLVVCASLEVRTAMLGNDAAMFLLSSLESLPRQIGVQFFMQTLESLVSLLQSNQSIAAFNNSGNIGYSLLQRLLGLLNILVSDPTNSFDSILQNVMELAFGNLHGFITNVEQNRKVGLLQTFFAVLFNLFQQHWSWFLAPIRRDNPREFEDPNKQKLFFSGMEILLVSFQSEPLSPDLTKFNLNTLNELERSHKLYRFPPVREQIKPVLVKALLDALVNQSLDILEEEYVTTLYNIAASDFEQFYGSLLPSFIQSRPSIAPASAQLMERFVNVKDKPTFQTRMLTFANDLCVQQARTKWQ